MPSLESNGEARSPQAIRKHSLTLAGHRTSLSLEEAFWDALKAQARAEGRSLAALVEEIDRQRQGNLSSAVRVYVLEKLQGRTQAAAESRGVPV